MVTNSQHLNDVSSFRCDRMVQSLERDEQTTKKSTDMMMLLTITHLFCAVKFTGYLQTSSIWTISYI